jgi:carbonic anhydrase
MFFVALAFGMMMVGGCAWAAGSRSGETPEAAWALLIEGHARYLSGRSAHPHANAARRQETSGGQHPVATVVGCSDSRVPVEIIFDQGIGDLFVVRVPGNVCNADEVGAVEYGVGHLGTPLCVVLGHTRCGAVTAVVEGKGLHGHLGALVHNIYRAAERTGDEHPNLEGTALVEATARANVQESIHCLLEGSPIVRARVHQGNLKVVGAIYDVASGGVEWLFETGTEPGQ